MEKDEKQDERLMEIEKQLAAIEVRQEGKVDKASCEGAKGEQEIRVIKAVGDSEKCILAKMEMMKQEIINSLPGNNWKQSAAKYGGAGVGGGVFVAIVLAVISNWDKIFG